MHAHAPGPALTPACMAMEESGKEIPVVIFNLLSLKVLCVTQIEIFSKFSTQEVVEALETLKLSPVDELTQSDTTGGAERSEQNLLWIWIQLPKATWPWREPRPHRASGRHRTGEQTKVSKRRGNSSSGRF